MAWGVGSGDHHGGSSSSSSSSSSTGANGRGPGMGMSRGQEGSTVGSGTSHAQRSAMRGDPDKAQLSP